MGRTSRHRWIDAGIALLIAGAMSAIWAWRDWGDLALLRLPDTDDMMRLRQVRDWLGGQAFADLSQHRLGMPPGLAMHWSRLADLGPAALILALRALLGETGAELAAVIAWPALLFAAAIFLAGRIAERLAGRDAGRVAMLLGAVAYPMTAIFLPGRIDHHAMQIVLMLAMTLALVRSPTFRTGLAAGAAAAISLMIGLEMAPLIAAAIGVVMIAWILRKERGDRRLAGFATSLGVLTLVGAPVLRSRIWPSDLCDSFGPNVISGMMIAAAAMLALSATARFFGTLAGRAVITGTVALVAGGALWALAPACIADPYHAVDPLVARLWLGHVAEARPLFALPAATAIGYGGMMIAGIVATLFHVRRAAERRAGWITLLALQAMALAVSLVEARGAHVGAALALPSLAAWIVAARHSARPLPLAVAWLGSAGIVYAVVGGMVLPAEATPQRSTASQTDCTGPDTIAALRRLPPGRLMAPIDMGAYALASTKLSIIAAPYHRDNEGNAAMYRFFLGSPTQARAIVRAWRVDYVANCPSDLATALDEARPDSVAHGGRPEWLEPLSEAPGLTIYRVRQ